MVSSYEQAVDFLNEHFGEHRSPLPAIGEEEEEGVSSSNHHHHHHALLKKSQTCRALTLSSMMFLEHGGDRESFDEDEEEQ